MKMRNKMLACTSLTLVVGFNNNGWKMDGDKIALDENGNPIYVASDGREMSVKHDTIATLNAEAKSHRTAKEAAEAALAKYDGLDPAAARDALEKIGKIDQKQLIDAGKVDEVKDQITRQYEGKLAEKDNALNDLNNKVKRMTIDNAFATSEFYDKNIAIPRDFFESRFGGHFDVDDSGRLVAKDSKGNPIYSPKNVGELATFDEALNVLVDTYPQKDQILKAPDQRGTGNNGGGGNRGGGRVVRRADFDAADPAQKAVYAGAVAKGEMQIVD